MRIVNWENMCRREQACGDPHERHGGYVVLFSFGFLNI